MSRLWTFQDYDTYVAKQRSGSRRRMHRQPSIDKAESLKISHWCLQHNLPVARVLCHGARCGTEVGLFHRRFRRAEVIGTDLEPLGPGVVQWDFQKLNPKWNGWADVVYSNSIDHACFPEETIMLWLSQLKPSGRLFLQWTSNCLKIVEWETLYQGGDCYGAYLHEYIRLLEKAGRVFDLLYCGMTSKGSTKVVIVGGRKDA